MFKKARKPAPLTAKAVKAAGAPRVPEPGKKVAAPPAAPPPGETGKGKARKS